MLQYSEFETLLEIKKNICALSWHALVPDWKINLAHFFQKLILTLLIYWKSILLNLYINRILTQLENLIKALEFIYIIVVCECKPHPFFANNFGARFNLTKQHCSIPKHCCYEMRIEILTYLPFYNFLFIVLSFLLVLAAAEFWEFFLQRPNYFFFVGTTIIKN